MASTPNRPPSNRCGLGSGSPAQELQRWLREAGRITVHDEGEQAQLFDPKPVRMYRLFNRAGESILITAETAHSYGLRPNDQRRRQIAAPDLFAPSQGFMFNEEG